MFNVYISGDAIAEIQEVAGGLASSCSLKEAWGSTELRLYVQFAGYRSRERVCHIFALYADGNLKSTPYREVEGGAFATEGLDDIAWGLASASLQFNSIVAYSKTKMNCKAEDMTIVIRWCCLKVPYIARKQTQGWRGSSNTVVLHRFLTLS